MHAFKLVLTAAVVVASCSVVASTCVSDMDCSLAGKCVGGSCKCEAWTKGVDCAALNLDPMAGAASVKPLVQPNDDYTRWGGSPVLFEGKYHLFSAEMRDKCSLSVWGFKSTVIHSVANNPMGPFKRLGVAIGAEAHNPVLSRATDGTWLLWTCGCPNPKAAKNCTHSTMTCPGGAEAAWTTTVYSATSLDGPWIAHVDILGKVAKLSQNVSPVHNKDGSVDLMFKGPDNNTEASILSAPHWKGPYSMVAVNVFAKYYAENITNEDCWMWRSADGNYHALSHRMTPADRGSAVSGGHAFSRSLTNWSYARTPAYTTDIALSGGATLQIQRRERPQLLFNTKGEPSVLYNGIMLKAADTPAAQESSAVSSVFTFAQGLGGQHRPS